MDYSQVLSELEQACADFQVPATRVAAEQQLQEFGKRPDAIAAGKYALVNSSIPTAKFFAVRAIKEGVIASYSVLGLADALDLRDDLFRLALENSRGFESFVLDSLCWVIAVITKRAWTEASEQQRSVFTQTLCEDIVRHSTPCIGIITAIYLIDEIAGASKCSQFKLPWEFHYACKTTFENTHMPRLFEAALQVIHRQLQRSSEAQNMPPAGRQTIAYERRSALHIADRVLNWEFTSSEESKVIAASFGSSAGTSAIERAPKATAARDTDSLDDGESAGSGIFGSDIQSRAPLFPRVWQPLLLSGEVLSMFFAVYEATLSDQMHAYFSPGSSHLALQCLVQISGIRGKEIFSASESRSGDALRAEFAQVIMKNQLQMIRHVCSMDLVSESSEDIVVATTQMVRRFIETQLEEPPTTVVANETLHPLAFLVVGVPETLEYFGEISKFICMLLNAASGVLRSDMLQRIDDDFGDVDNYFIMQAFDELANAWSTVISEVREWEYLSQAAAASSPQGSSESDETTSNRTVRKSFMHFLVTTAYLIRSEYIQLRMLMCEGSVSSDDAHSETFTIDHGLLAKDYVVYEDQLQFFALLARLDVRTSLDRLHENLTSRCHALQDEFNNVDGGIGAADSTDGCSQHTIDLLHEQAQWIVLMIGYTLCDAGASERVLIPQPVLEYSNVCGEAGKDLVVQSIMAVLKTLEFELGDPSSTQAARGSPLLVETLFWTLRRIAPVYLLLDLSDYQNMSQSIVATFGCAKDGGNGASIVSGILDLSKRAFDLCSAEEDVLQMCISMLRAMAQRPAIAQVITSLPQFMPLIQHLIGDIGRFPETVHGSIIEALALLACHSPPAQHESAFAELRLLVVSCFARVVQAEDFAAQRQDAQLVNKLLDGLDMMDGLLTAANFRNMDAIVSLFFEVYPLFEQLLAAYPRGHEIPGKVIQVMESAARYLDPSTLPSDDQMLQFSRCFRGLLHKYQEMSQGQSLVQDGADVESLGEAIALISTVSYLVRNDLGLAQDEASHTVSRLVSDDFGETETFGLYCVHVTATPAQLLTPNVLRMHVQLLAEMIKYRIPSLIRWLPTRTWSQVIDMLLAGVDNSIYDVSLRTYEAISKLGAYIKVIGIGGSPDELRKVFGQGVRLLLEKLLHMLLFSSFDVGLVESAGAALITLGLIDPEHLQACFRQLFSQSHSTGFAERLSTTLAKFNADLEANAAVKALLGSSRPIPDSIDGAPLRQPLFEFLVNTRAVLRIK
ncbi:hypothetical protein GGF46_002565 [Coemansia sp. RSA 552]|nr:hypothetical protein GGF46_002565 [Coemansia sp. RSA 552]